MSKISTKPFVISWKAWCFIALFIIPVAAADKVELPRKWGSFDLNASYQDSKPDLTLFKCRVQTTVAKECRLLGYPTRDDFVIIRFYKEKLVSVAEFRSNVDWEKTFAKTKVLLGKPTLPAYQSDRAVAYIWHDKNTHITLTHLLGTGYVVYEMRDRATEPLYRKSVAAVE